MSASNKDNEQKNNNQTSYYSIKVLEAKERRAEPHPHPLHGDGECETNKKTNNKISDMKNHCDWSTKALFI